MLAQNAKDNNFWTIRHNQSSNSQQSPNNQDQRVTELHPCQYRTSCGNVSYDRLNLGDEPVTIVTGADASTTDGTSASSSDFLGSDNSDARYKKVAGRVAVSCLIHPLGSSTLVIL